EYQRGVPDADAPYLMTLNPNSPATHTIYEMCTPVHRVRITKALYFGKTEVTQGQFRSVTGTSIGFYRVGLPGERYLKDKKDTSTPPAENLGWGMAVDFCDRLSNAEGFVDLNGRYRLPTEAEWTLACMAGTKDRYWYGPQPDWAGEFEVSMVVS